jgi:molecular chaperone GrpE
MADEHVVDPPDATPAATDARERAPDTPEPPAPDLAALRQERDDYHDRLLRKTAEFENYRKRIDRERREQGEQALGDLLLELLHVVDDFERALTVDVDENPASYRRGVELIHTKLHDLLRKRGVRPLVTVGEDFDPTIHEAVVYESSPDRREGEVIGELRRGYMLGDRLLRAALVKVAKA